MAPDVALLGQGTRHGAMVLGSVLPCQHVARMRMRIVTAWAKNEKAPVDHYDDEENNALGMWEVAFQLTDADPRRIALGV